MMKRMITDRYKNARRRPGPWIVLIALLGAGGPALAASTAPDPPPSPAQIEACVQQFDMGKHWRFDWKVVDIGPPRRPQNNLEALAQFGGNGLWDHYGYPVHVIYRLNGTTDIDAEYWVIRNAQGAWQIPAICQAP